MKWLLFIETRDGKAIESSLELFGAAALIHANTVAVCIGNKLNMAANSCRNAGADTIVTVDNELVSEDNLTAILTDLAQKEKVDGVLASATPLGKSIIPRVAARIEGGCLTDITAINENMGVVSFSRPAYGGTVIEHLTCNGKFAATVRGDSFDIPMDNKETIFVEYNSNELESDLRTKVINVINDINESINLEDADVIVAGGRGMGSAENFKKVEELASLLGGVSGGTRPAIENGWISRSHQIGQSGKIVAPKLYIACGISGATQHTSGMLGSKYIVAINKDEDAPIFRIANVGIVGDVNEIIPLMINEISNRNKLYV